MKCGKKFDEYAHSKAKEFFEAASRKCNLRDYIISEFNKLLDEYALGENPAGLRIAQFL
ncbi:MAG: hypothetical protein QW423_02905 [Candidatus Aenigmatarchaeota archaeon]